MFLDKCLQFLTRHHLVSSAGQSIYGTLRAGWRKQPKLGRQSRPLSMLQRHSARAFRERPSQFSCEPVGVP